MNIVKIIHEQPVPVTIFQVEGSIDVQSAGELAKQAQAAFEAGARNLILDLTRVTFLSSSGLRAIHQIFTLFREPTPAESDPVVHQGIAAGTYKSWHLKLVKPAPSVLNVLKMSGFDMFLDIYDDSSEALAALAAR